MRGLAGGQGGPTAVGGVPACAAGLRACALCGATAGRAHASAGVRVYLATLGKGVPLLRLTRDKMPLRHNCFIRIISSYALAL